MRKLVLRVGLTHNSSITFTQALDDPKGNETQATCHELYYNDIVVGSTTFPNATKTLVEVDTGGHEAIAGTSADAIILQDATRTALIQVLDLLLLQVKHSLSSLQMVMLGLLMVHHIQSWVLSMFQQALFR